MDRETRVGFLLGVAIVLGTATYYLTFKIHPDEVLLQVTAIAAILLSLLFTFFRLLGHGIQMDELARIAELLQQGKVREAEQEYAKEERKHSFHRFREIVEKYPDIFDRKTWV